MVPDRGVHTIIVALVLALAIAGCRPVVQNDSEYNYRFLSKVAVDDTIYLLKGTVSPTDVITNNGIAQVGYKFLGTDDESGSEVGLVRLRIDSVEPQPDFPVAESTAILKVYGSPAQGLVVGDRATFRCRVQYEVVGAVKPQEELRFEDARVTEFEFCRLYEPVVN